MPPRSIRLGDRAPLFTLQDQDGVRVSLDGVLATGPVLLIFYPGDLTPGCTLQLNTLRDEWKTFKEHHVSIFGINHADAASHRLFRNLNQFPFSLLCDEHKRVSGAYDALRNLFDARIIQRTVVGIGMDGVIHFLKRGMPKCSDMLKALKQPAPAT